MAWLGDWFRRALDQTEAALEESGRRLRIAWAVLRGRPLVTVELRPWNRRHDPPSAMDVHDLASGNILFTVLVWPDLADSGISTVRRIARAERLFGEFQKTAPQLAAATYWEVTHALRWDPRRQVWTRHDGEAFEGPEVLTEEGPHAA